MSQHSRGIRFRFLRWLVLNWPLRAGKGRLLHKYLIPRLPSSGEFTGTLPGGQTFGLRYDEAIGKSFAALGTYEPGELAFIARHSPAGACNIDVGANIGIFTTVMASAVGPTGKVLACEPVPGNITRLRDHLARNQLDNVTIIEAACGDQDGTLELFVGADAAYATADQTAIGTSGPAPEKINVPVQPLDTIWEQHGSPAVNLVKIDVEGAEPLVLAGAKRLIESSRPLILIEANDEAHLAAIRSILDGHGYRLTRPRTFARYNYLFRP